MGSDLQSQWILEFLLRQPIEDRDLLPLISALSLSVHDHGVAKTLLLKRISSVINNDLISGVLESLELIQELNHLDGILISESMKAAYCAVARGCIMKYLKENPEYSDAVVGIWRDRILDMEKREVHLISDWLKDLKTEIEEAMRDVSVLNSFSVEDAEKDALNAVKLFLKNTTDQMGPSFLEVVEKTLLDEGENVQTLVDTVAVNNHVRAEGEEFVHENMSGGACSDLDMHCSVERPESTTKKCNPVSTPEFKRVQESLKSSVLELHEAVKDPLPDALDIAASIAREVANNFQSSENQDDMDMDRSEIYTDCENGQSREGTSDPSVAISRRSILDRNNTARTYEWDEDEDKESSTEGSRRRLHLPSPQSIRLSPLRKQVTRKTSTTGRRIKKKWSSFEESTLIDAVREYGRGKWKTILNAYSEIFDDRTEGDLKDKWRNLNK